MQLPNWFLATAAGKVAVAEATSAREVERRQLLEQLAAVDAERDKSAPMLAKRVSESAAKLAAARDAAKKAEVAHRLALSASNAASTTHTHRRAQLTSQLKRLNPLVTEFVRELHQLHADTLASDVRHRNFQVRGKSVTSTNAKSLAARAKAIATAIAEAETMITEDIDDLSLAIDAIRAGIPEVAEPATVSA